MKSVNNEDEDISQGEPSINFFEKYIEEKYTQVHQFQDYLVKELQSIEKNKQIESRIKHLVQKRTIPILQETSNLLHEIKKIINPLYSMATSYVQEIHGKCKDILL